MLVTDPLQPDFVTVRWTGHDVHIDNYPTLNEHIGENQTFWVKVELASYPSVSSTVSFQVTVKPCIIESLSQIVQATTNEYLLT